MLRNIGQDKHGNKRTIYKKITATALTGLVMVVSAIPVPALADTSLPVSPLPQLLAQVQSLTSPASPVSPTPAPLTPDDPATPYNLTSGAVLASASPITVTGNWRQKSTYIPQQIAVKPTLTTPVVMEGQASYYSVAGCLGCDPNVIMANGEPLHDDALTIAVGADKKQYVGYNARVTNLATGQSVVARITDTGGFYQAKYGYRVADLTIGTKTAIGIKGGLGQVRVEIF